MIQAKKSRTRAQVQRISATQGISSPNVTVRLLQRKCACSGAPEPVGECEDCRKKRWQLENPKSIIRKCRISAAHRSRSSTFARPTARRGYPRIHGAALWTRVQPSADAQG